MITMCGATRRILDSEKEFFDFQEGRAFFLTQIPKEPVIVDKETILSTLRDLINTSNSRSLQYGIVFSAGKWCNEHLPSMASPYSFRNMWCYSAWENGWNNIDIVAMRKEKEEEIEVRKQLENPIFSMMEFTGGPR